MCLVWGLGGAAELRRFNPRRTQTFLNVLLLHGNSRVRAFHSIDTGNVSDSHVEGLSILVFDNDHQIVVPENYIVILYGRGTLATSHLFQFFQDAPLPTGERSDFNVRFGQRNSLTINTRNAI